jgi:hypothetical protein
MKRIAAIAALLLCASAARAHKPSDSYLTLRSEGARLAAQWDIALRDLDFAIGLDNDGDGAITWGELRVATQAIAAYALARLDIDADGEPCTAGAAEQLVDDHSDGAYAVLRFPVACAHRPRALTVRYRLFFDFDPQHRGLLHVIDDADRSRTLLLSVDQPLQRVDLAARSWSQTIGEFWWSGVWHIWTGFDHVLFLLALLLPAVLRRDAGRWHAVGFAEAVRGTCKVVTAFTVAHSLTLGLAALGMVHLPARLVESAIAASVVVAALNNAVPFFADARWLVGFGFGLLHGFGFASVLADPGLPIGTLVLGLLGFNVGVECGQLVIVATFLPLAYAMRRSWLYQRVTLVAGSCAIAIIATVWLIERALDLQLL